MDRIKIAIDPKLKAIFGNEICWTWRLLLTGIGLSWEEVSIDSPEYDIGYIADNKYVSHCRVCVRANIDYWLQKSHYKIKAVKEVKGWQYPVFEEENFDSQLFHVVDGHWICERDIIFYIFWLVTGQEEQYWVKNKHGHFNLSETSFYREETLRLGLASAIGSGIEKLFSDIGFCKPIPRWPNGKQAAACVSHDVDYPEVIRWLEPLRIVRRKGIHGFIPAASLLAGTKTHWHFESWMLLEKRLKTRSAFYFTARKGSLLQYALGIPDPFYNVTTPRFKKLFRYLVDEGFEIGLHASYRAFKSLQNLRTEKQVLEKSSNQKINGNRHHYLRLDLFDPESTLLMHEQAGLVYDTSLSHDRYIGWRRGLTWPFFPYHQKERRELRVLQIPTAWIDNQLFGFRKDNSGDRVKILRGLRDKVLIQKGCLLIDVHEYVFDEVLFPEWSKTYHEFWQSIAGDSKFWIETPGRIADHWIRRCNSITQTSEGLVGT